MTRLLLAAAVLLALAGPVNAGDKIPAAYLGTWCEMDDGSYRPKHPGKRCRIDPLVITSSGFTMTELRCKVRSFQQIRDRGEIVARCQAEEDLPYVATLWFLATYPKGRLEIEWAER